jgi:hypothetical protein
LVERAIKGIAYDPSGDGAQPNFIKIEPRWVPINSIARSGSGAAQSAYFSFVTDIYDLLERTTEMLNDHAGPLSTAINMGIRTYVENTASTDLRKKRREDFEVALVGALRYCAPMVEENGEVLGIVHPGATLGGRNTYFSPIPFENTPLHDGSKQLILKADPGNMAVNKASSFNTSTAIKEIEFYSTITNARNPVVFNSLMTPIASDWNARVNNQNNRISFWALRRTKPLIDSIPVAEENLQRMVTGWFATAFTGGLKIDDTDANKGPKVSVYSLQKKAWVDFPHPLLGLPRYHTDHDYLPAVLTSLTLALVRVNEFKSLDPLVPYQTLQNAGSDDKNFGYRKLFTNFVEGNGPSIKPSGTPEEARIKLKSDIALTIEHFQKLFDSFEADRNPFATPQFFEIRELVMRALNTLHNGTAPVMDSNPGLTVMG